MLLEYFFGEKERRGICPDGLLVSPIVIVYFRAR